VDFGSRLKVSSPSGRGDFWTQLTCPEASRAAVAALYQQATHCEVPGALQVAPSLGE